jgi:polysaccharide chain length determinant protein (PEP-CTERM system associated)
MDDLIRQGIAILQGMWQRRWIGLAAAWIVGIAGVVVVMRMPDVYEASARIYVDTQSVLKPLMQGLAVQPNVDQQVMILSRTLISRPNVEKLIRMADLDLNAKTKADQDAMVDGLIKSLKIDSLGRDNLYTLAYRDPKPEKAKRVVQSLASIFIESNLGAKRKDSDSAKKFIDEQIKVYEKKLEEAEDRLKEFKIRNLSTNESLEKD